MEVLEGQLGLEASGHQRVIGAEDGEVCVKPWEHHRLYPIVGPNAGTRTRFLLSGAETAEAFRLDVGFFQNWYGYQDEVVMRGGKMDIIQVMCVSEIPRYAACIPLCFTLARPLA